MVKGGPSLNPKGRPRTGFALAEMIRERLGQPGVMKQLTELAIDVALGRAVCIDADWLRECGEARDRGDVPPPRPKHGEATQPTIADQQRAWEWLCKYGGFTPPTQLELSGPGAKPIDLTRLSPGEMDALELTLRKAAGEIPAGPVLDLLDPADPPDER
jgi:hypothetical protein